MHGDSKTQELIEGCLNNDRQSQRALYELYAPQMYPICIRYVGEAEAEDILVEAFVSVFTHLHELKKQSSLNSWIFATVVRTALMHLRKEQQRPYTEPLDNAGDNHPAIEDENAIIAKMDAKEVMNIIAQLPEMHRIIFNMHAIDDFKFREIADELGINASSVRVYYQRARQWILTEMEKLKR